MATKTVRKPRLHTFKKTVIRPGEYGVPVGKKRVQKVFTADDLKELATTINEQIAAGHKIPAPFKHYITSEDGTRLFTDSELIGKDGSDKFAFDASLNGGFWKSAEFVEDASLIDASFASGPALISEVEAPGDLKDPNTPAGKIGTTVQETSIGLLPKYTDSTGKEWKNYVAHIAMPVHAVEKNQDNFALAMSEEEYPLVITMSDMVPTPTQAGGATSPAAAGPDGNQLNPKVAELIANLRQEPFNLTLPPDTSEDNLIEMLCVVVPQRIADAKTQQTNSVTTPPPGSQQRPAPVAMDEEANETVTMSEPSRSLKAYWANEAANKKANLKSRLQNLVAKGVLTQTRFDSILAPRVDALTMSEEDIDDEGNFPVVMALEDTVVTLEEAARNMPLTGEMTAPDGHAWMTPPANSNPLSPPSNPGEVVDLTPEQMAAIGNSAFGNN